MQNTYIALISKINKKTRLKTAWQKTYGNKKMQEYLGEELLCTSKQQPELNPSFLHLKLFFSTLLACQ